MSGLPRLLLDVLGPVAALIVVGAVVAVRLKPDPASLSRIAYWVLGPAFAFDALVGAPVAADVVVRVAVVCLAGMVAAAAVALAGSLTAGFPYPVAAASVLTAAYGNVGNAGIAIAVFALGDDVLPVAVIAMLTINVTGLFGGVALATARTSSPLRALWSAISAPMTAASIVALLMNWSGFESPTAIDRSVGLLAAAMIPMMLLILGIQLASSPRPALSLDLPLSGFAKLVVAPVAAWLTARALGFTGDAATVAVIQSAMPPAVLSALLAMEHDLEPERVTSAVVLITVAALVTLPVVLLAVT